MVDVCGEVNNSTGIVLQSQVQFTAWAILKKFTMRWSTQTNCVYGSTRMLKLDVSSRKAQIKQFPVNTTQCILFFELHPASNGSLGMNDEEEQTNMS